MDYLLKGATLVDGSGSPPSQADVAISGGTISEVSDRPITAPADKVVDLDGLVLAPGFIDVHTHYDAQVFWDPDLTPSSWHGVTTVIMGNCGFGIAPTRPEHRSLIALMLENVEGMSLRTLEAGLSWTFETFPEYLTAVEQCPKRVNVAAMVGHSPVRVYVMGEDAMDREATPEETGQMRAIVDEAVAAGAIGFATSKSPAHFGAYNRPVPSRLADYEETRQLVQSLGEQGRGTVQATVGPGLMPEQFADMSKATGRPVTWTALLTGMADLDIYRSTGAMSDLARKGPDIVDSQTALGGEVWPQVSGLPLIVQMSLARPTNSIRNTPAFQRLLSLPVEEWDSVCGDPAWRAEAKDQISRTFGDQWSKMSVGESATHGDLIDIPFDVLGRQRSTSPFDLMVDIAMADRYETRFRLVRLNDDEAELTDLLNDKRVILGLSDAGAHVDQLCDARFATHLLSHWVREKSAVPLELAIWRLTGQPAHVFRLPNRGLVRSGFAADLVAFDPATVGHGPLQRVWDSPGGADRLIAQSRGMEHIWVNGTQTRRNGEDLGAYPGTLIRSAFDHT
jgi:N-acyl-D-aspartate/D-glutamate deacylase